MIGDHYHAVVLGGGPAGLAAALALRRQAEVSVLVVEAGTADRDRIGECAPADLLALLDQLGLTDRFIAAGHASSPGNASVWGAAQVDYNNAFLNPMGTAWRLDRRLFDRMLADAAAAARVEILWRTQFLRARSAGNTPGRGHHLQFALADGRVASTLARWVIDATGSHARFACAAGARMRVDDQMFALVRFSSIKSGSMTMQMLVEATRDGWWYAARLPNARLPGRRVVTMFVTDRDVLHRMTVEGCAAWEKSLASTTLIGPTLAELVLDHRPAECRTGGAHHVFPVCSSALDTRAGDGWIAAGDAASSYDPIAQGLFKALADGVAAGQQVAQWIATGGAPGDDTRSQAGFHDYNRTRAHLYGLERRWPDAPFWRTRQERAAAALDMAKRR
jgi:2-polyprenyl-6-methoxyphenol hydroxylase-like FAD-dependent oxidoreductase